MNRTDTLRDALAGRYEVERELGTGGMATVYLARDLRHHRKVAIKVLHAELALALGVDRFLSEIRVTATLQHPNILPLLDSGLVHAGDGVSDRSAAEAFGSVGSVPYYVMPYVEGESLRARLQRERQLPIGDALHIARGVAGALGYAHKQGIIHRDIKPENILLQDGQPVVADFGIALAVTAAGGERLTQTGLSLGTPHYMSPEQAMGERELDARSDIYALGVITFEMLVGEPPFTGPSAAAIVAKVLTEKARPLTSIRDTVPAHVDAAVRKSLQKLPADRFATASEFASALGADTAGTITATHLPSRTRQRVAYGVAIGSAIVAAGAVGLAMWSRTPRAPAREVERWQVVAPEGAPMNAATSRVALSPDGKLLAYTANVDSTTMIHVVKLGVGDPEPLAETRGGRAPFFSPDGKSIGFISANQLSTLDLASRRTNIVIDGINAGTLRAAWTDAGTIVVEDAAGYGYIRGAGASLKRLDARGSWLSTLPGDRVLFMDFAQHIRVASLADGSIRYLTTDGPSDSLPPRDKAVLGVNPHFVAPGYLVYWLPGAILIARRFDPTTLRVTGDPVEVQRGVIAGAAGVSASGVWAYPPEAALLRGTVAEIGENGIVTNFDLPARRYFRLHVSPDARRAAITVLKDDGRIEVAMVDVARKRFDDVDPIPGARFALWSASGSYLYAFSERGRGLGNIVSRRHMTTGATDSISLTDDQDYLADVVGEDTLVIWRDETAALSPSRARTRARSEYELSLVPFARPQDRVAVLRRRANQTPGLVSPSRRWIAFTESGNSTNTVVVEPFSSSARSAVLDAPPSVQVRVAGTEAAWGSGDRLYIRRDQDVYRSEISSRNGAPVASAPVRVAGGVPFSPEAFISFGPSPAPQSVLAVVSATKTIVGHLTVIRNWDLELARALSKSVQR